MPTTVWQRQRQGGFAWTNAVSKFQLIGLPAGDTILRIHFAWGFDGATSTRVSPQAIWGNLMTFGLVTTVGNGTEAVPHPIANSSDVAPPTQRWLYWSVRNPRPVVWDAENSSALWSSSLPEEEGSTKGQVAAPGNMGAGNTLNLWATWVPVAAWDVSGLASLWFYASLLFRTP